MSAKKEEQVFKSLEALRESVEAEAKEKEDKAKALEQAKTKAQFQKAFDAALGEAEDAMFVAIDDIGMEAAVSETEHALKEREGHIRCKARISELERIKDDLLSELAARPGRYQDILAELKDLRKKANSNYVAEGGTRVYQAPPEGKMMNRIVELEKMKRHVEAAALSSVQGKIDTILDDGGKVSLAFVVSEDKEWTNWKDKQAAKAKRRTK